MANLLKLLEILINQDVNLFVFFLEISLWFAFIKVFLSLGLIFVLGFFLYLSAEG